MKEEKKLYCSECGTVIHDSYYKCLDNFLQVKYFDSEEENCFCSEDCFCKYISLSQIDLNKDEENDTD